MNKTIGLLFTACLLLLWALPMQANEPDSVYLFSYAKANGTTGLRFAWSVDGENEWMSVSDGFDYVKSDYGPWGSGKKMFTPHLQQDAVDGEWHCIWYLSGTGKALAHAASKDLLRWGPQSYFAPEQLKKYQPSKAYPTQTAKAVVSGVEEQGYVQFVPYTLIEDLVRHAEHKKYRQLLIDERTEQDPIRFARLNSVEATINVDVAAAKPISQEFIGIFFEDINYAADGGLYAELVQNRDFEYMRHENGRDREWGPKKAWKVEGNATFEVIDALPIHENNSHYALFEVKQVGASLMNSGYDGITLKKGEKYDFSLFARKATGGKGGKVLVRLLDEAGKSVGEATVSVTSQDWKQRKTVLTALADVKAASLQLIPQTVGTYHFDMVSLFPQNTFKGRKNGLRADLAQTLADLHPRFVRFPGGCVAHGNGIDNIYDWKGSIGPLEARKPLRNLWGYHQTRGLGYHEYFLFCEDMGAEPVPVVAAGVPCQNSGIPHKHSTDELSTFGQQGGIAMEKMPEYVQDVLDLIEYANGDAKKSVWGRKRAEAGHPKPFNLKYIGIGNEDLITEIFEERFVMIYNAVKEKYPEVTVIGTVGPFYEGTDYDEGWKLATKYQVPMVDEHYYVAPGWMIHNQDYYDGYDRSKAKVYLGEYAAHLPGRPNNIETALAEALYLTSVERNADVVTMTSYAPLLAKEGYTQWNPDLIYFNNQEVKPTVGYYTQQMYGQHAGTHYLPSEVILDNRQDAVKKRVGVSVVKDERTGDYIIRLVNMLPTEVNSKINLEGIDFPATKATKVLLSGDPKDRTARSVTTEIELTGNKFEYTMPAYSFTVIRL
ncbi:MAG: alpha-L-arabinofuranosidase [Mediterranea massiliensis]|nr:alpha-L-arabinofuranosidase [Mediterranea massiliensis]